MVRLQEIGISISMSGRYRRGKEKFAKMNAPKRTVYGTRSALEKLYSFGRIN